MIGQKKKLKASSFWRYGSWT